jgi:hypothetical protein
LARDHYPPQTCGVSCFAANPADLVVALGSPASLQARCNFALEGMKTIPDFLALHGIFGSWGLGARFDRRGDSHYSTNDRWFGDATRLDQAKRFDGPFIHTRDLPVLLPWQLCARVCQGLYPELKPETGFNGTPETRRAKKRCGFFVFIPSHSSDRSFSNPEFADPAFAG